ncbi:biliverdin-producing heme oxygenase [Stenotrophomonas sp.]|uniref:biliverdin-producing heme oxygenase n=1 Tax=Stenotrophomonas sp. TaxID=69392 RepID=UPI0028A05AEF|nr:biliverdin-producing heme oxygenase [Stenotrophomonas sp.]
MSVPAPCAQRAASSSVPDEPLSAMLKTATRSTHERLDQRLMALGIFDDRRDYLRFLQVQAQFHSAVAALYRRQDLPMPATELGKHAQVLADLQDLGAHPAAPTADAPLLATAPLPVALGWWYVAEGSSMGAAVLLHHAARLGLHEGFGARHLAPAAAGVAAHWRSVRAAMDALALTDAQRVQAATAASAAFEFVGRRVDEVFRNA